MSKKCKQVILIVMIALFCSSCHQLDNSEKSIDSSVMSPKEFKNLVFEQLPRPKVITPIFLHESLISEFKPDYMEIWEGKMILFSQKLKKTIVADIGTGEILKSYMYSYAEDDAVYDFDSDGLDQILITKNTIQIQTSEGSFKYSNVYGLNNAVIKGGDIICFGGNSDAPTSLGIEKYDYQMRRITYEEIDISSFGKIGNYMAISNAKCDKESIFFHHIMSNDVLIIDSITCKKKSVVTVGMKMGSKINIHNRALVDRLGEKGEGIYIIQGIRSVILSKDKVITEHNYNDQEYILVSNRKGSLVRYYNVKCRNGYLLHLNKCDEDNYLYAICHFDFGKRMAIVKFKLV